MKAYTFACLTWKHDECERWFNMTTIHCGSFEYVLAGCCTPVERGKKLEGKENGFKYQLWVPVWVGSPKVF